MSFQVPAAFVQTYSTNVQMLLQQKGGRIRDAVTVEKFVGNAASAVEQFGVVTPAKNLARHSQTPIISTPQAKRWITPNDYDWADLIDKEDRLRMLIDPEGPYTMNARNAMARAEDEEFGTSIFNNNLTGQNGTTLTPFAASQIIAVNVGTSAATAGMNIAKLRAAKKLFLAAGVDVDNEPLFAGITSIDHDNLLNEAQAISLDYNDKPVLVDGRIKAFMGFTFIQFEFIDAVSYPQSGAQSVTTANSNSSLVASTGFRLVPFWAKSYVKLGMWNDIETSVDKRPDLRNSVQVYVTGTFGVTRLQEKGVVQAICN